MNVFTNVKTLKTTANTNHLNSAQNTNALPAYALGNQISNYFTSLNNESSLRDENTNLNAPSNTLESTDELTTTLENVANDATSTIGAAPIIAASAVTSGLIHANNQTRDAVAQRSENFDAQHIAQLQDSRDETVGEIGMGVTTALGATTGLPGVAVGAVGTGIAEALDTVNSDQTMSTAGFMTNATQGT